MPVYVIILIMTKILILGGGFGGIRCALDLEKKLKHEAEIILIDKNSYHLFIPAIYEVASAYGIKKDPFAVQLRKTVCIPYSDILEDKKIKFLQADIAEINLNLKTVTTRGDHTLEYDYLVLGIGSEVNDYGIPGVTEYANQFKSLDDAIFINQKLEELSEQFTTGNRTEPFSFLICGGGFTGIELAAELGCCSGVIKKRCRLKGRCSTITIFEAGPKILPSISEKERKSTKERLTKLGIMIMENSPIEEVGANFVKLKSGQKLQGDLIVWTAGIKPSRLIGKIGGLPLAPSGKIMVEDDLRVKGFKNIFALGDAIEFKDPKVQKPVPALAYVAAKQGRIISKNISNSIKNKKLLTYKPFYSIFILPTGGKYALVHLFDGPIIKGFVGWILRLMVDVGYFLTILSPYKAFKLYFDEMTIFLKND